MMLTGQNGILNRAGEAKDKTGQAQKDENEKLSGYESVINDYGGSSEDTYVPIEDISDEIDGLPQKKTAEELPDYIPIYTTEQFLKVASGETCEIKDTNGVSKGTYTMSVDAKYALMNDLDFESQSSKPIKNFVGEFEGNGCIITNVNIDTSWDSFISPESGNTMNAPAGLFEYVQNGKISNLAVTNSIFKSSESKGAIVGQGGNIKIENCYSKNNEFYSTSSSNQASGSIIGYVYKNGAIINKCKAIYSKWVSGNGYYFGGICGTSNGSITISDCKVIGDNSEDNKYDGGIINCVSADANVLNCSVQNIKTRSGGIVALANELYGKKLSEVQKLNISNCSVKGVETTNAGVIRYVDKCFETNINECKVENLTIGEKDSYDTYTSGICSTAGGKITISNCSVIGDGTENNKFNSGIVGTVSDDTNISNCRVQDIRTEIAGIVGNASILAFYESTGRTLELNISNCSVKNTYTKNAGILGYSANYFKTNITKCKAENLTLDGTADSYSNIYARGVIAATISNDSRITDCIVKDIDIATNNVTGVILGSFIKINYNEYNQLYIANCKVENIKIYNTNAGFGGIIGNSERKVIIENCSVSNIEGESGDYAGGIAGNINGYRDIGKSEIKKCSASDIKIKAANSKNGTANVGGIVGYGYFIDISDCNVSNSKIENGSNIGGIIGFESTGTISNCTTKNINLLTEKGRVGGIIGGTNETAVENCNVYGGSIIATNGYDGLGGICGVGINVSNCIVENLQIDAPNTIGVGGIVGNGLNYVSTSLIQKCKVKNCKIKGKDYVGGIAGAAFINISDCQVNDSTIEGTDGVGGIQGFGGKFRSTDRYIPIRIDKGEVTNTEIKGSTNVNKIQGQNTYIINSTDPTQDTITNCKYNGSDISQ